MALGSGGGLSAFTLSDHDPGSTFQYIYILIALFVFFVQIYINIFNCNKNLQLNNTNRIKHIVFKYSPNDFDII